MDCSEVGSGSGSSGTGGWGARDDRDDRDAREDRDDRAEEGGSGATAACPNSRVVVRAGRVVAMNSRGRGAVRIASKTRGDTELASPAITRITGPLVLPGCSSEDVEVLRLISVAWLSMLTMLTLPNPLTTSASAARGLGRFVRPTPLTRGERFIALPTATVLRGEEFDPRVQQRSVMYGAQRGQDFCWAGSGCGGVGALDATNQPR